LRPIRAEQATMVITMHLSDLTSALDDKGLTATGVDGVCRLPSGEALDAATTRRLACQAGIVPMVLGGDSVPLDIGHSRRLATAHQRRALTVRDGGCVFPGCGAHPSSCEAHHLHPWNWDGPTNLGNLVLLCPHHHGVVEPNPLASPGSQWEIIMIDGLPGFRAPIDLATGTRTTLWHSRFKARRLRAGTQPPKRRTAGAPSAPTPSTRC